MLNNSRSSMVYHKDWLCSMPLWHQIQSISYPGTINKFGSQAVPEAH